MGKILAIPFAVLSILNAYGFLIFVPWLLYLGDWKLLVFGILIISFSCFIFSTIMVFFMLLLFYPFPLFFKDLFKKNDKKKKWRELTLKQKIVFVMVMICAFFILFFLCFSMGLACVSLRIKVLK